MSITTINTSLKITSIIILLSKNELRITDYYFLISQKSLGFCEGLEGRAGFPLLTGVHKVPLLANYISLQL